MKITRMPVGIDDFYEMRTGGYYFVDKSEIIEKILSLTGSKVTLFTRPRRFGKTLCMNMLAEFFDIRKDSRDLFKGLKIAENKALCDEYMNKFPTVFITLKDIKALTFEKAYSLLEFSISELYMEHSYLADDKIFNKEQINLFNRIMRRTATTTELQKSIYVLASMLQQYYNNPVVLLIDEYDVPIAHADQKGYYNEMIDVIGSLLSQSLKGNSALNFAVITGCLKIAKESIFTGLNNLEVDTILSDNFDEYFGFTEDNVKDLLSYLELEDHFTDIKEWYDGYKFGNRDVYCPWDVVNYARDLIRNHKAQPQAYWNNTSGNSIVRTFIDRKNDKMTESIEKLIDGEYIVKEIADDLTYNELYNNEQNLWSVMYFTGYLTKANDQEESNDNYNNIALKIPNKEVMLIFKRTILRWFEDSVSKNKTKQLITSIWDRDEETATKEMTRLLRKTISYHDYKEDFYHAFLAGVFTGAGYAVKSNRENGEGRSDIAVSNLENGRIALFEIKRSKSVADMRADCEKALSQIAEQGYEQEFYDDYDEIICYGISFFKKRCKIVVQKGFN